MVDEIKNINGVNVSGSPRRIQCVSTESDLFVFSKKRKFKQLIFYFCANKNKIS